MIRTFILLAFMALPAAAQEVIADLSQNRVSITASFDGSEILVFGAIKHDQPLPEGGAFDVIVTITGPNQPITVRRKEKVAGIWINQDAVEVDEAPSFYSISTTRPLSEILSDLEDLRYKISINRAIRSVGAPQNILDAASFTDALIRIRTGNGLYQLRESKAILLQETLFSTNVALPSNLVEGAYTAEIYLTRDRKVISSYQAAINVQKVGLERWIYALAHERPLIYGLLSLAIAIAAGWIASAVFRYLRG
jgi:uncharacterized protein (TIGR02186 family)